MKGSIGEQKEIREKGSVAERMYSMIYEAQRTVLPGVGDNEQCEGSVPIPPGCQSPASEAACRKFQTS